MDIPGAFLPSVPMIAAQSLTYEGGKQGGNALYSVACMAPGGGEGGGTAQRRRCNCALRSYALTYRESDLRRGAESRCDSGLYLCACSILTAKFALSDTRHESLHSLLLPRLLTPAL